MSASKPNAGQMLREGRTRQRLTVEECSKRTHISIKFIQALEEERWSELPSESHRVGFLRLYARFLGVSAEEVIALYQLSNQLSTVTPSPETKEVTPTIHISRTTAATNPAIATPTQNTTAPRHAVNFSWPLLFSGLAAVVVVAWAVYHVVATEQTYTQPRSWRDFKPRTARLIPGKTESGLNRLKIVPERTSWIHLATRDKIIYSGILPARRDKEWDVVEPAELRLADVGAVQVYWNEQFFDVISTAQGTTNIVPLPPKNPPPNS